MSAHTPGPWCVRDLPTAQRYIGPSHDGGAPSVAFVLSRVNVPDERLDADARLVAAAPELLYSLLGLLDVHPGTENKWTQQARAAIAKATGSAA
jgi:hypothetical protein